MSQQSVKARRSDRWRNLGVLLGLGAAFLLVYLLVPSFKHGLQTALGFMARGDIKGLREYLLSFGAWAPIISGSLMLLHAVLFPIPSFILTVTNGLLFGAFWGTILSWSSAEASAAICYAIGRVLGRPAVERLLSKKALVFADRLLERYGNYSVLVARLVPVISFDAVGYIAGVTSIRFWGFMIATGIGQLPATILYSMLGESISQSTRFWFIVLSILVAVLIVVGFVLQRVLVKRMAEADNCREGGEVKASK